MYMYMYIIFKIFLPGPLNDSLQIFIEFQMTFRGYTLASSLGSRTLEVFSGC